MRTTTTLEQRAAEVAALFRPQPGDYEKLFSPVFLQHVSPAELTALLTDTRARMGNCIKYLLVISDNRFAGKFEFVFEKGYSLQVAISIDPSPPNLINGLLMNNPRRLLATFDDIAKELDSFPGEVSFLLARLSSSGSVPLLDHHPDRTLAIGSAFKLYVLCELIRSIEAGRHRWSDVAYLNTSAISLPSGSLQQWPANSPLTLHTLAALMISQSDNTATDQLIQILGREKIEEALRIVGHSRPEMNVPFLTTLEMFKLKYIPQQRLAERYLAMDERARRNFLTEVIACIDREEIVPATTHLDTAGIEWFASASDLCRAMSWIQLRTEAEDAARPAREILAINSGLTISEKDWRYVGYKGGAEPGVLNLTLLLQSAKGQWYVCSASWNNAQEASLDESRLVSLVERALQLID
ncbi:MAG: serine hydrolase [Pyrinomonadaceae bacterium]